jgi:hypothetical protein
LKILFSLIIPFLLYSSGNKEYTKNDIILYPIISTMDKQSKKIINDNLMILDSNWERLNTQIDKRKYTDELFYGLAQLSNKGNVIAAMQGYAILIRLAPFAHGDKYTYQQYYLKTMHENGSCLGTFMYGKYFESIKDYPSAKLLYKKAYQNCLKESPRWLKKDIIEKKVVFKI